MDLQIFFAAAKSIEFPTENAKINTMQNINILLVVHSLSSTSLKLCS